MIARAAALVTLLLTSCTSPPSKLPACWNARNFKDGESVVGRVTLLIPAPTSPDVPSVTTVSPLTCETQSFIVENAPDFGLERFSSLYQGDDLFAVAVEARIVGTVKIDYSEVNLTHGRAPFRIVLSKVEEPTPIARPGWWHMVKDS